MGATDIEDQNANNLDIVANVLVRVSSVAEDVSESFINTTTGSVGDISSWPTEALEESVSRLAIFLYYKTDCALR